MNILKCLAFLLLAATLQSCASGPGKPGEVPSSEISATPNNDYIYRSPPPDVARALQ
jgi:hypothetical protein